MKKTLFFLFWMVPLYMMAQQAMTSSQAEWLVKRYYDAYSTIARNHGKGDVSEQTQQSLYQYCINGVEFTVANEFYEMKGLGTMKHAGLRSFSNIFMDLSRGSMNFSYELVGKPELRQKIADDKKDTGAIFAMVRVKKKYVLDGKIWEYTDTVGVDMRKGRICSVNNSVYPFTLAMQDATSEQLQAEALKEYAHKNYNLAFSLLQEALKKDPTDVDVSYQLGVMTFNGQGCRQYKKKVRDYLAEFYWLKSFKGRERLKNESTLGDNYSYINLFNAYSGYEYNPFPYNRIVAYSRKTGKFGFLNSEGKMVIPQKYKMALPFMSNGTTIVLDENDNSLLIDTAGRILEVYNNYYIWFRNSEYYREPEESKLNWCDTQRYVFIKIKDSWGCKDRVTGDWMLPVSAEADSIFCKCFQAPVAYRFRENGKFGLKSIDGKVILPAEHKNVTVLFYHERESYGDIKISKSGFECICIRILYDFDENGYNELIKKYKKTKEIPDTELRGIGTVKELERITGVWDRPVKIEYVIPFTKETDTSIVRIPAVLCVVKPKQSSEEKQSDSKFGLRKMHAFYRIMKDGSYLHTVDEYWKDSESEILPCEYSNIIAVSHSCDTSGQPIKIRLLVNYSEEGYKKLKQKYTSIANATDAELKKVGTVIKKELDLYNETSNN